MEKHIVLKPGFGIDKAEGMAYNELVKHAIFIGVATEDGNLKDELSGSLYKYGKLTEYQQGKNTNEKRLNLYKSNCVDSKIYVNNSLVFLPSVFLWELIVIDDSENRIDLMIYNPKVLLNYLGVTCDIIEGYYKCNAYKGPKDVLIKRESVSNGVYIDACNFSDVVNYLKQIGSCTSSKEKAGNSTNQYFYKVEIVVEYNDNYIAVREAPVRATPKSTTNITTLKKAQTVKIVLPKEIERGYSEDWIRIYYNLGEQKAEIGWAPLDDLREFESDEGSGDYDPNGKDVSEEVLALMKEKYENKDKKYDNVRNMYNDGGLCIFAFEGLGDYSGEGDTTLFPTGRFGAMMVATIGAKVVFVTKGASTLPSTDENGSIGTAVPDEGVYYIYGKNHQGKYPAFACNTVGSKVDFDKSGDQMFTKCNYNISVTRNYTDKKERYQTTADGINIHTAPNLMGSLYSVGCQLINTTDYIDFLFDTGCVSRNDTMAKFLQKMTIDDSICFRGDNPYPKSGQSTKTDVDGYPYKKEVYGMEGPEGYDGKYWYIDLLTIMKLKKGQELQTGYYIIDRTKMDEDLKKPFYLD